jgi:3-deoxy-D-manno-octulosonic-acid transferase
MPRWAYTFVLRLLLPIALIWFVWRSWRRPAYRAHWREPMALDLATRHDRPLWLHAASVGEAQSLAPLLQALAQLPTPAPLLLTVGTPTGLAHARTLYTKLLQPTGTCAAALTLQMMPWDLPGPVSRFLRANQPRAAVFVETELWPNMIASCVARGIPQALISARVSDRSLRRYQRVLPRVMREAVCSLAAIATQTEIDRSRFIALGADAKRVVVAGNLKFDIQLPEDLTQRAVSLRAGVAAQRPLWVAGSTHPVEEGICVDVQRQLLQRARAAGKVEPLLVLAPRRPERFDEVASWLAIQGLRCMRSSAPLAATAGQIDVLLLDVMGELQGWYAAADVAFVGGSLVPVGGHNLLEPAALGKPVLAGPHSFNSPEAAQLLQTAGALQIVRDRSELVTVLEPLLSEPELAKVQGAKAAAVVAANRGAADRALALIAGLAPAA